MFSRAVPRPVPGRILSTEEAMGSPRTYDFVATPTGFAARAGAQANHEPAFKLGHLLGVDHILIDFLVSSRTDNLSFFISFTAVKAFLPTLLYLPRHVGSARNDGAHAKANRLCDFARRGARKLARAISRSSETAHNCLLNHER